MKPGRLKVTLLNRDGQIEYFNLFELRGVSNALRKAEIELLAQGWTELEPGQVIKVEAAE